MEFLLLSCVVFAVGVTVGLAASLCLWPQNATYRIPDISVSPGRCRVIFRFADGLEDRKTLFQHSIKPMLLWKGKQFKRVSGRKDPVIVYDEAIR